MFNLNGALPRTLQFTGGVGVINSSGSIAGGLMSGGEWAGSGNVTINSLFSWTDGAISGTGTTTTAPESVLQLEPGRHDVGRPMLLEGYTNWMGGDIELLAGGSIRNDGDFGALNQTGTVRLFRSGGGTPFVNNGTFAKFFGGEARVDSTFNNAGLVTIPGGKVTLAQGGIQTGDFNIAAGATLELGAGLSLATTTELVGAGTLELNGALVSVLGDQSFDGQVVVNAGSGIEFYGARTELGALTINAAGSAALRTGGGRHLVTKSLQVNLLGQLDVADNALIVDYDAGASPIDAVRAAIAHGCRNGQWNGTGIRSSAAMSQPGTAIGYAEAGDIFTNFPATFAGESIDDTAVVMRHTLKGDANLDGHVNLTDFNRLAGAFGQSSRGWSGGDFDYDDAVNLSDFNALAANFGRQI
jgi:hypothetical protein